MSGALQGRAVQIIGAGIAGLTAALALTRRGAQVSVHEQATGLREVGAGIQISPNAGRVLSALGLDGPLDEIAPRAQGLRMWDAHGRAVARLDWRALRPGQTFRAVHRARLVEMLEAEARAAGVTLHLGQAITMETLPEGGLIIGADGLHSVLRRHLNGAETPFFTGQTAWRALIPDAEAAPWADLFMGPGRHLVSYPLGQGIRNVVAVVERPDWPHEDWSHRADPEGLRRAFADFRGPVPGWLAQVEEVGIWGLFRHTVAARWQDGRLAILGDAAHPTLPFMAQGACMAIEDAWTLAACLDADPDQPRALARYESLRAPRCQRIVGVANANARHYHMTGPARPLAHGVLRAASRLAPGAIYRRFGWIYDFDPTAA